MPTLDSMSTADDAASRLSQALDEVFSKGAPDLAHDESSSNGEPEVEAEPEPEPTAELTIDTEIDSVEPVPLPRIVPATADHDPIDPVLPARSGSGAASATRIDPAAHVAQPVTARVPSTPQPVTTPAPAPAPAPARAPASAWGDHMTTMPVSPVAQLRGPGGRPRVRRVTRVLRHIDPWSTFKVALLFSLVGYVVALTSGVLLWRVADSTGTLDNVERWFTQFGWETFQLKGDEIFHNATIIGLFVAVAVTGGLVLLATLFNLVSDIVGGVRLTVLEEEVVERTISSTRRYVVRRPPSGGVAARQTGPDWDVDGDEPVATAVPASGPTDGAAPPVADWTVDDD